ncbi:kinesin-associated protein-domain-containing protein [Pelagophyceae sp. CCMP2097]|nr:kinesin-associated protein-domain-containing protein [Pelagophyceae sp. CCMP2097]|mmetsp:Transcript_32019/g.107796  ORF Transcript_32019/g.107796 Transcript_32019/m.107796 type:complete len:801 (-) Transcript_32019:836-3238(-)
MDEETKVKKKVFPGLIEEDRDGECAIVVHYETALPGQSGRDSHEKKLHLKKLDDRTDPAKMTDDIMKKCKYIPASKRHVVETLVANLQERFFGAGAKAAPSADAQRAAQRRRRREGGVDEDDEADMDDMDDYIEMLYEGQGDMKEKVRGTRKILALCRHVGHLEDLVQRHTLMGALSRVLAEDHRRSHELSFNIIRIFIAFSNFVEMHSLLSNYRVGAICCDVLEAEVKRSEHRDEENSRLSAAVSEAKLGLGPQETTKGHEKRIGSLEVDQQKQLAKSGKVQKRQDKTLYVCLKLLVNLAEDLSVEQKMAKKHVTEHVVAIFAYSQALPLLRLAAAFLKKLSLIEENKSAMMRSNLVGHLARFVPCSAPDLVVAILRLLFNASFDAQMREQMVKAALVPRLVGLLREKNSKYREISIRVLYHLSVDDRCKGMFAYTDAIPILMQLIVRFPPDRKLARELAALAVNLSLNASNAELMCANKGLQALVQRVERTRDALLMKVVRNVSLWTHDEHDMLAFDGPRGPLDEEQMHQAHYAQRGLWARPVGQILAMAVETDSHDLLVETLGTLGNLSKDDLLHGATWGKYMEEFNLAGFLSKLLVPGMAQHDVVLEAIIFTGVLAQDKEAALTISASSLARSLEEVWRDKSDDAEIILQLLFTFTHLFRHKEAHDEIVYNSRVLYDVLHCLGSGNAQIVLYAEACLDLVMEHSRDELGALGDVGAQVRKKRFQAHNREWLEVVEQEDGRGGARDEHRGRANFPSPAQSDDDEASSPRLSSPDPSSTFSPNNDRATWGADEYGTEW